MRKKMNPRNNCGERNIHCPYYSECLDLVVKRSWENWNCNTCHHRKAKRDFYDALPPMDNGMPYYTLSRDINLEAL